MLWVHLCELDGIQFTACMYVPRCGSFTSRHITCVYVAVPISEYGNKMESNQSCIATDDNLANNLTIVQEITIGLLSLIVGLIILGVFIGVLLQCPCCKSSQTTALLSTGVIVKLALIPGVEDEIVRDVGSGGGTNRGVEKVYLKVSANCPGEKEKFEWYKFNRMFSILLFPGAMVLVLAYASVFITSLLELSEDCQDANSVNSPKNCYTDISRCPPLNCDLWKELGQNSTTLVCISYTPDLFNPLERFVSLLAVQVALLSFYSCCCNRGCSSRGCSIRRCSINTCGRYCCMCVFNLVFLGVLGTIITLVWTESIPGLERNEAFVNMVIPFVHLLFVSLVESYILLVFVLILCYDKPKKMSPNGSIVPMEDERLEATTLSSQNETDSHRTHHQHLHTPPAPTGSTSQTPPAPTGSTSRTPPAPTGSTRSTPPAPTCRIGTTSSELGINTHISTRGRRIMQLGTNREEMTTNQSIETPV